MSGLKLRVNNIIWGLMFEPPKSVYEVSKDLFKLFSTIEDSRFKIRDSEIRVKTQKQSKNEHVLWIS